MVPADSSAAPDLTVRNVDAIGESSSSGAVAIGVSALCSGCEVHVTGSPTVDAGQTDDANNGAKDLDLDARTLSEDARVLFRVERLRVRHHHRRHVRFGSFAQQGFAGGNTKRWSGKIGKRKVRPGRYRVTLTATYAAGNRSARKRLKFRVVRG